MSQQNKQKIKLLRIVELLRHETDENHPMTTEEITQRLWDSYGISCDRRSFYQDIICLNKAGFEIMSYRQAHYKAYYIADRSFQAPELKILIDAIQAASFIPEDKSAELIEKLADLGGSYRADLLKKNLVRFNTRKHNNETVFYSVAALEEAIQGHVQASFFYFDLNEDRERVYRKDKQRYVVEPLGLLFHEDNYYLVAYSLEHEAVRNYRVDRMDQVTVEETPISGETLLETPDLGSYTEQVFKMFAGRPEYVTLEFDDSLIGVVYDKFGEETTLIRTSPTTCVTKVRVQVSPTFWGWLFQFVGQMRVLSPERVADEYRQRAEIVVDG